MIRYCDEHLKGIFANMITPIKTTLVLSQEIRTARLTHLKDKIKNYNDVYIVLYKEKQIAACLSISNFLQREEIKPSIINLKDEINELEKEKRCIHVALSNSKSRWYQQKK